MRHWGGSRSAGWLSVGLLTDSSTRGARRTTRHDVDSSGEADIESHIIIQVVKRPLVTAIRIATRALVEDVAIIKSERAIGTNGPSRFTEVTSLYWIVELELMVGCNVSGSAFVISEDTVGEGDGQ